MNFIKKISLLFSSVILTTIISCGDLNSAQQDQYDKIMDLHDLSMKHHSEMMNIAGEVRKYKDNPALPPALQYVINPLMNQVEKADEDMMAWMNQTALQKTLKTGEAWFWSRSRQTLWHKGATSGNIQKIISLHYDCDGDTILAKVHPAGPACHTGEQSCFFNKITLTVNGKQ